MHFSLRSWRFHSTPVALQPSDFGPGVMCDDLCASKKTLSNSDQPTFLVRSGRTYGKLWQYLFWALMGMGKGWLPPRWDADRIYWNRLKCHKLPWWPIIRMPLWSTRRSGWQETGNIAGCVSRWGHIHQLGIVKSTTKNLPGKLVTKSQFWDTDTPRKMGWNDLKMRDIKYSSITNIEDSNMEIKLTKSLHLDPQ